MPKTPVPTVTRTLRFKLRRESSAWLEASEDRDYVSDDRRGRCEPREAGQDQKGESRSGIRLGAAPGTAAGQGRARRQQCQSRQRAQHPSHLFSVRGPDGPRRCQWVACQVAGGVVSAAVLTTATATSRKASLAARGCPSSVHGNESSPRPARASRTPRPRKAKDSACRGGGMSTRTSARRREEHEPAANGRRHFR